MNEKGQGSGTNKGTEDSDPRFQPIWHLPFPSTTKCLPCFCIKGSLLSPSLSSPAAASFLFPRTFTAYLLAILVEFHFSVQGRVTSTTYQHSSRPYFFPLSKSEISLHETTTTLHPSSIFSKSSQNPRSSPTSRSSARRATARPTLSATSVPPPPPVGLKKSHLPPPFLLPAARRPPLQFASRSLFCPPPPPVCSFAAACFRPPSQDSKCLPGQPGDVTFQQYAGYVTVDDKRGRHLFYYLVEAENDPLLKPLVLWLTGGPGCSSVGVGAFSEHGPFWPEGNGLTRNNHSWNREANMLYLDSPAGVGFSYSTDKSFYDNINDDITARDNIRFLEKWIAIHPKYVNRDIFISGESYGGHFVPQVAYLILKSRLKSNLKGILVGNPLLEFNTDMNSRAVYLWSHGVISDSTFEMLNTQCNFSRMHREFFHYNTLFPPCDKVNLHADFEIGSIGEFDISRGMCHGGAVTWRFLTPKLGVDLCIAGKTTAYFKRGDVQKALHGKIGEWDMCTRVAHYDTRELEITTLPYIATLIQSHIRVLLYSGDQDAVLPFIGTRFLVNKLANDLRLNKTQPYQTWYHGREKEGGWTEEFGGLLSFATIRGAGHEAPLTQPEKSLALFRKFVRGIPLPK